MEFTIDRSESEYTKAYDATVALHNEGVFPAPKALLQRLGLKDVTGIRVGNRIPAGQRLNGTKSLARAEALLDCGYIKNWRTGRWETE